MTEIDTAAAQAQFKNAVRDLMDAGLFEMIPVLASETALEAEPTEDGIGEALVALQRRAFEMKCDECGTRFTTLKFMHDFSHVTDFVRMQIWDKLDEHQGRHIDAGECPVNVSGQKPFGPVKLFNAPTGRTIQP